MSPVFLTLCSFLGCSLFLNDNKPSDPAPVDTGNDDLDDTSDPGDTGDTGEFSPDDWASPDLSCGSDSDCLDGEICKDSVCQMDRCSAGDYSSLPPIGEHFLFFANDEVVVADGTMASDSYWLDGFDPESSDVPYGGSYEAGGDVIVDVAGGDPLALGYGTYVLAIEDSSRVQIVGDSSLDVGLYATAVGMGDIDGDGIDEILSVAGEEFTACHADTESCDGWTFDASITILDVDLADLDGDYFEEAVMILQSGDDRYLFVHNFDAEQTGQPESASLYVGDDEAARITADDLDGDGLAEIVTLVDGGWADVVDDHLVAYSLTWVDGEGSLSMLWNVGTDYGRLIDLTSGDADNDESKEIIVLDDHEKIAVYASDGNGADRVWEKELGITQEATWIASADHDGDSVGAHLVSGPDLQIGAVVPTVVMLVPPYNAEFSDGGVGSSGYGETDTSSEAFSDTVSLGLSVDVGVSAGFMNLFKTKFSAKTGWRVSETITEGTSISIGERSTLRAATERFGYQYGAVSTAWGCFHSYSYEMSDPSNLVPGTDGYEMVLTVPVDGGTSVWSTPRYNALAEALGDLPVIEIPYTIGEVSSYPESPERLSGQKLQNSELLFSELRDYEVSDVATVSWSYSRGETTTNSQNVNWDIGASANVTVGSVSVGASVSQGWGQGYRLTVGQTALFFGSIPPLYDDLSTQNDEYIENSYRVTPVVYVETYTDASGSEAAYFVYTYAAD